MQAWEHTLVITLCCFLVWLEADRVLMALGVTAAALFLGQQLLVSCRRMQRMAWASNRYNKAGQ
jgi:hypothetical protein